MTRRKQTRLISRSMVNQNISIAALCWAIKTGERLHQHQPLKIKKQGRLAKSIFRYGFDYLRSIFVDLDLKHDLFIHSLQFLST